MNSFVEAHRDRLSHSLLVFGLAGLLFYAGMVAVSFLLKYSAQMLIVLKGMGL